MSTQHYFISSPSMAPTGRWVQAFAQGQVIGAAEFPARIKDLMGSNSIFWLPSAVPVWTDALALAVKTWPTVRVVVLSGAPEVDEGARALGAGARGYTHAYAVPELLQEVGTVVEHGGIWAGPELLQRLVASAAAALSKLPVSADPSASASAARNAKLWGTLSAREAEVAEAVSTGRSNKEVADKLFISERTVKAHLGAVFEKLQIRDRLQLVVFVASIQSQLGAPAKGSA